MKKLLAIFTAIILSIVAFFSATPIALAQQILSPVNNFSSLGHTILLAFTFASSDIESKVKSIIKEQLYYLGYEEIKPKATFIEDLGADSLSLVEIVIAVEDAFEIDISDDGGGKIRTVQDLVDYVKSYTA